VALIFNQDRHEYSDDGIIMPSVTQILVDNGVIDTTWFTEAGKDRGTAVHLALKYMDQGDLDADTVDEDLHGYLYAYEKFKRETRFASYPEGIEQPLADSQRRVAGTPDRVGAMFGNRAIIDFKTGCLEPWVALQLAGYEDLVRLGDSPFLTPEEYGIERYALQLKKDGKYKLRQFADSNDAYIFKAMTGIYHWKRNNKIGGKT